VREVRQLLMAALKRPGGRHMMNRRAFLTTMGAVIVAAPLVGEAEQTSDDWFELD